MARNEQSGRERRQRPRVPVQGEVLSRIHTAAAAPVLNISEGGALIEVQASLRPGTVYVLRLPLGADRELSLRSRVVRSQVHSVKPAAQGGEALMTYQVAVEFVGLTEAERRVLKEHLSEKPGVIEGNFGIEEDFD